MTELERLTAIEALKQLKARYFRAGDTKDMALMRRVLAEDCEIDTRDSCIDPVSGVDFMPGVTGCNFGIEAAIAAFSAAPDVRSVHQGGNFEVTFTDDRSASGIWSMTDRLYFPPGLPISQLTGYGHYHETYVKRDGDWLIRSMRLTRLRVEVVAAESH